LPCLEQDQAEKGAAYVVQSRSYLGHMDRGHEGILTMRSSITLLFVPGDRPERYAKAATSGADAIIIDLEDAVAPANKVQARTALCHVVALPADMDIFVRVNAVNTPWHEEDLAAIASLPLSGLMLAKTESAHDVEQASEVAAGQPVIALLETALGLSRAREISASACVRRLAFGSIDYCADIGAAHRREPLLAARSEIVLASRLSSLLSPIDGVCTSLGEEALLEDHARYALDLGFGGKLCIHPSQIAPVRIGFAPTREELAWAQRTLATGEDGATSVDGTMVDAPVRVRARQILRRANRAGTAIQEEAS
jgi:citrate lyase subunit beta/citryl-CoA lyase